MLRQRGRRRTADDDIDPEDTPTRRRSRWRMVLLVGVGVLVVYYGLVVGGLRGSGSGPISLSGDPGDRVDDRITVEVEAVALDPADGALDLQLRPVPRGDLQSQLNAGELRLPLQVQLASPGEPPANFDFGTDQLIDPVGASVGVMADPYAFPFDEPEASFSLSASSDGAPVPLDVEVVDGTDGWDLSGAVDRRGSQLQVVLDGRRETLAISFAVFYIAGIVVVALITVAVIGGAMVRGNVDFDRLIWLGAMLVAIPAVRNEMPGVPPIGTAVDLFVFLPSVVIVGVALLAAIVVVAINEAADAGSAPAGEA